MARIKLFILLCSFLFVPSLHICGQPLNIGFHIKGLEKKSIILGYYKENKQYILDTLLLDALGNAKWIHTQRVHEGMYFVIVPGQRYFDLLIAENQKFEIYSDAHDLVNEMKIIPECESSEYLNYQKAARLLQDQYENYERREKMELADSIKRIRMQMHIINQRLRKLTDSLIILYQGSLTSKILNLIKSSYVPGNILASSSLEHIREYYQRTIRDFANSIDLSDTRLIYTPYLWQRLDSYFNKLVIQKNDSLIPAIQELMDKAKHYWEYFDFFRRWLIENYSVRRFAGSEMTYVFVAEEYFLKSQTGAVDTIFNHRLGEKISKLKAIIPGAIPKDLDLPDTSGKIISFTQIKQHDIILFFYDSECGPCKYTRSEITALLNRLDSRNIAVYAINMNDNHKDWSKFIKLTGPEWIHVSSFPKTQELTSIYMIDYLPGLFLVGPDKRIIAGKMSFPEIEKILRNKYSFLKNNR